MKHVMRQVSQELVAPIAFALCSGCALYLLAFAAIRVRIDRRSSRVRLIAAVVLTAIFPVPTIVPALAALALVTVVRLALHTYELLLWQAARAESRALLMSP